MALTDVFTGAPAIDAAAKQRAFLGDLIAREQGLYGSAQTSGIGTLEAASNAAGNQLASGYGTATGALTGYLDPAVAALTGGTSGGLAALRSGVGQAAGAFSPALATAGAYGDRTTASYNAMADALGWNGPEGIARSRSQFTTSPGYQFATEQGIQGIERGANISGMAPGGNTLRDVGEYVTNAANQQWGDYLNRIAGIGSLYAPLALQGQLGAGQGQANAYLTGGRGAADILTGGGTNLANLYTGTGRSLADLATGYGTNLANIYTGTAGREADLLRQIAGGESGALNTLASPYGATYGTEAAAQTGGSANLWNLGLNLAKLYAGTPSGTPVGASGTTLGNLQLGQYIPGAYPAGGFGLTS